ncbi:FCD domain-containing protein [Bradyrhizobium sp. Leo121]|uniref:FadR/GntR family transcriptional regulator n=1 Tax=Bradyrhizobium sp. Leo121 TaxID=1571195 RepID=UPI00102A1071|nr:FCD domain-containing protein [Bradyrhizobium sp. Leo121]RZN27195.1 FadR family transcriptional regulator [Bradyrhizobium sp. Leo121]
MQTTTDENVRERAREAAREIRRFIQAGIATQTLKPGDKLPTEREIAARFMAARNTVRKTLDSLEQEGIIIREVGRGTFVSDKLALHLAASAPPTASANLDLDLVRKTSPRDLMEFRLSLEPAIAELAVARAGGADIERMQAAIDQSRVAKSLQQFEDCDDALHCAIATSTRNPLFSAFAVIVTQIRNQGDWGALKKKTLTDEMRDVHTVEHVEIVDAIRRRDAAAARAAMTIHLQNVKAMMFRGE